jgi:malto-oligosyltrehalose trehalohydrolase
MPFGAQVEPGGQVRFRAFAPAAEHLSLVIESEAGERGRIPLTATADGWFETLTEQARAGQPYWLELADGTLVPDPASRAQAHDVHGASVVVDPRSYRWQVPEWNGRPWEEAVIYELHVGTFTEAGTFTAARERIDHLMDIGVTAVELMPVAEFPGRRGWGYDGVLPFAPEGGYGTPDELKALVDDLHDRGLMAFLDVAYNHFGPEGNYLPLVAPRFLSDRHPTPWGAAIDFSLPEVRAFFIHNALYWLEEYRFDGLRLDAVHAMRDQRSPDILEELAMAVRGSCQGRHIHLIVENALNDTRRLVRKDGAAPASFTAQWNDDFHHAAHVVLTGEQHGYYREFVREPVAALTRSLSRGFLRQTQHGRRPAAPPSQALPPTAFVNYLQNHDQVGNRADGARLASLAPPEALKAMMSVLLLAPPVPLLFMGEEWGARTPFRFFCDYRGDLAESVRAGRHSKFAQFRGFRGAGQERIPDPSDEATFAQSRLDWTNLTLSEHEDWLGFVSVLLRLRQTVLTRRLVGMTNDGTSGRSWDMTQLSVQWTLADGAVLSLAANLGAAAGRRHALPPGELLFESAEGAAEALEHGELPGWSACWFITEGAEARR